MEKNNKKPASVQVNAGFLCFLCQKFLIRFLFFDVWFFESVAFFAVFGFQE
jgi:hypothetical protein